MSLLFSEIYTAGVVTVSLGLGVTYGGKIASELSTELDVNLWPFQLGVNLVTFIGVTGITTATCASIGMIPLAIGQYLLN